VPRRVLDDFLHGFGGLGLKERLRGRGRLHARLGGYEKYSTGRA
jgi:hypothetical protein